MRFILPVLLILCIAAVFACGQDSVELADKHPVVVMKTTLGTMEIALDGEKAPRTVRNFLDYANEGFYDNTIFHRAPPGIMIQGGGYTVSMQEKETNRPIKNEAANGLKNTRGTIAMARDDAIDSATSQFFINLKDNPGFDHRDDTAKGYGYAVFGEVISGMEVADSIAEMLNEPGGGKPRIYSVRGKESEK